MIWLIGCKGMLGTEIARQLKENEIEYVGTDIDVDITNPQTLADFAKEKKLNGLLTVLHIQRWIRPSLMQILQRN